MPSARKLQRLLPRPSQGPEATPATPQARPQEPILASGYNLPPPAGYYAQPTHAQFPQQYAIMYPTYMVAGPAPIFEQVYGDWNMPPNRPVPVQMPVVYPVMPPAPVPFATHWDAPSAPHRFPPVTQNFHAISAFENRLMAPQLPLPEPERIAPTETRGSYAGPMAGPPAGHSQGEHQVHISTPISTPSPEQEASEAKPESSSDDSDEDSTWEYNDLFDLSGAAETNPGTNNSNNNNDQLPYILRAGIKNPIPYPRARYLLQTTNAFRSIAHEEFAETLWENSKIKEFNQENVEVVKKHPVWKVGGERGFGELLALQEGGFWGAV